LWNSGIFVWKVSEILKAIENFMPSLHHGLVEIGNSLGKVEEGEVVRTVFSDLESTSIDYGIMERAGNIAVIPAGIGWSDVGSWTALEDIFPKDKSGNIKYGNVVDIDSSNSIIYAGKRVVAVVFISSLENIDGKSSNCTRCKSSISTPIELYFVLSATTHKQILSL